ncbi:MAG: hypothetical protein QM775_16655 [Pirellulales bacterium]
MSVSNSAAVHAARDAAPPAEGPRMFKDADGREWLLRISVETKRRLIAQMQFDIGEMVEDPIKPFQRLTTDDVFLAGCLWAIVEPQAQARGVSMESFADAILGDALYQGGWQVCWAIVDFFPDPRARENLRGILMKALEIGNRAGELATKKIAKALSDANVESIAQALIKPSGVRPASSASTRRHTRSKS